MRRSIPLSKVHQAEAGIWLAYVSIKTVGGNCSPCSVQRLKNNKIPAYHLTLSWLLNSYKKQRLKRSCIFMEGYVLDCFLARRCDFTLVLDRAWLAVSYRFIFIRQMWEWYQSCHLTLMRELPISVYPNILNYSLMKIGNLSVWQQCQTS